jgi:GNAT superfamily N-acetyltransferase
MIRAAGRDELQTLTDLLVRSNDQPYDIGAVAEEKCFGHGLAGPPAVHVYEEQGSLRGLLVTCGRYLRLLAVDRPYRRRGIGSELMRQAAEETHVVFAEAGNYFTPGIVESDSASIAFFQRHGYREPRWTQNLVATDLPQSMPEGVVRATPADRERVLAFVEREFGRIWRFEAAKAFTRELPPLVFTEKGEEVTGFAAHDVNNVGLGFFGPTGVIRSLRGRGVGRKILLASLADLRRLGYTRAVIPWTDALDFYRKSAHAEVTHRFLALTR